MGSLGCPCYRPLGRMNWAPVLGLCQEPGRFTRPAYKSSASWAWGVGLHAYFFKLNQLPPSPWLWRAWARVVSLLKSGATSTWPLRAGLVWLGFCHRQTSYGNNDFSTFALISSSSFSFLREYPLTVSIVFP